MRRRAISHLNLDVHHHYSRRSEKILREHRDLWFWKGEWLKFVPSFSRGILERTGWLLVICVCRRESIRPSSGASNVSLRLLSILCEATSIVTRETGILSAVIVFSTFSQCFEVLLIDRLAWLRRPFRRENGEHRQSRERKKEADHWSSWKRGDINDPDEGRITHRLGIRSFTDEVATTGSSRSSICNLEPLAS